VAQPSEGVPGIVIHVSSGGPGLALAYPPSAAATLAEAPSEIECGQDAIAQASSPADPGLTEFDCGTEHTLVAPCAQPLPQQTQPAVADLRPPRSEFATAAGALPDATLNEAQVMQAPCASASSPLTSPELDSSRQPARTTEAATANPTGTGGAGTIAAPTPAPVESEAEEAEQPHDAAASIPEHAPGAARPRRSLRPSPDAAGASRNRRTRSNEQAADGTAQEKPAKVGRSEVAAWECDISLPAL
jgi:hypothetical protein